MTKVNKARGDVALIIGDEKYVLRGTFANLAALQTALNVDGLAATLQLVQTVDPRAMLEGVRCLAVSGDVAAIDDIPFMANMNLVQEAIMEAITAAMGPDEGNVNSGTETTNQ